MIFLVIVIVEVDKLTRDAQHSLRRTMEKYIGSCRVILCCNSTSRVIPAIRSRCLAIRIAAPTIDEVCSKIDCLKFENEFLDKWSFEKSREV